MKLDELKQKGAFIPAAPVLKEVVWEHGDEDGNTIEDRFDVFVKRASFGEMERFHQVDSADPERSRSAIFISQSILLGDDASESMTYEDAYQLEPSLARAFVKVINDANGIGKKEPKNLQPLMSSGTSSSSTESAAEPSQKQKSD